MGSFIRFILKQHISSLTRDLINILYTCDKMQVQDYFVTCKITLQLSTLYMVLRRTVSLWSPMLGKPFSMDSFHDNFGIMLNVFYVSN